MQRKQAFFPNIDLPYSGTETANREAFIVNWVAKVCLIQRIPGRFMVVVIVISSSKEKKLSLSSKNIPSNPLLAYIISIWICEIISFVKWLYA